MMHGITITDYTDDNLLAVDLVDIFRLLGSEVEDTEWELSEVESVGNTAADELHRLAGTKARVPGQTMLQLAAGVTQIIDGVFTGYRGGQDQPWIIIEAVDSSAYDVQSEDEAVLARIRQRFNHVADLPTAEEHGIAQLEDQVPTNLQHDPSDSYAS